MQKYLLRPAIGTAIILLIPFAAMQFNEEVNWGLVDFLTIGTLVFVIGLAYELLSTRMMYAKHRVLLAFVLILILLLAWIDLAVGIFNIPGISGS